MNIKRFRRPAPGETQDEQAVEQQPKPFSVDDLEAQIREVAGEIRGQDVAERPVVEQTFEPSPLPALPAYITPAEGVSQTGQLTAEAVALQYEATAKAIDAMAADLVEMQKRMEQETRKVHSVIEDLQATAQLARDEGKAAFERIERMSKMTEQVRKTCDDIRLKLAPQ